MCSVTYGVFMNSTELLQFKIKDIPSLQPLRRKFYVALIAAVVCGVVCLGVMMFASQMWVVKLICASGLLYCAIRMQKIGTMWSAEIHNEYTICSQKLLDMCLSHNHQQVKKWLDTPNIQPWAQHVVQQYLKNYASAAA